MRGGAGLDRSAMIEMGLSENIVLLAGHGRFTRFILRAIAALGVKLKPASRDAPLRYVNLASCARQSDGVASALGLSGGATARR